MVPDPSIRYSDDSIENMEDSGHDPFGTSPADEGPTHLHRSVDEGLLTAEHDGRSHQDEIVSRIDLPQNGLASGSEPTAAPKPAIGMKGKVNTVLKMQFQQSSPSPGTLIGLSI